MKSVHVIVLAVIAGLAACGRGEPAQTVDWYRGHDTERKAMVDRCHADPGKLSTTPNCINASRASDAEAAGRRGYVQPPPVRTKIGG